MEANPYLPPEAALTEVAGRAQTAPAFAVSITKLVVMSIATLGGYQLVWFYRNWQAIKRRTRENIQPVWRTFFAIFWCYSCFQEIDAEAQRSGAGKIPVGALASGWIILSLLTRLPDPWWLVSMFSFVLLIPVQRQANALNDKLAPEADRNSRFTWANILWVVFGALFWLLLLIGLMLPPEAA